MALERSAAQSEGHQVSVKHTGLILDHFNAPPALKLVAVILGDHADSDGVCFPSYRKIAERACLSERSVRRYVKELQNLGIVTKLRTGTIVIRDGQSYRISNAYRLNAHVIAKLRAPARPKLSTAELGISAKGDHLETSTGDHQRRTPMTTKPSIKHNLNHNPGENGDNSRQPSKLDLDDLIDRMLLGNES